MSGAFTLRNTVLRNAAIHSLRGVLGGVSRRRRAIGSATHRFRQQLGVRVEGLLFGLVQWLQ